MFCWINVLFLPLCLCKVFWSNAMELFDFGVALSVNTSNRAAVKLGILFSFEIKHMRI